MTNFRKLMSANEVPGQTLSALMTNALLRVVDESILRGLFHCFKSFVRITS